MSEANHAAGDAVILIPAYEPDDRLPAYIRRLEAAGFGHIVVVDDGSGEKWDPVFQALEGIPRTRVIRYMPNGGKGHALKTGYRFIADHIPEASGVITADADGQHTVEDCIRLAEKLEGHERELYLGARDFSLPEIPPKSRFGNRMTSAVFRALYGQWLDDTQTGLRAFRREELPLMMETEGDRYEYEMKVLIACTRAGIPIISVPIETIYENNNEGSHFHPIRDSWRIYRVILGSFFRFMEASLICFLVDQGLAFALREWLLPAFGLAAGSLWNINISGWGARIISAVLNFQLNRKLVFRMKGSAGKAGLRYAVVALAIVSLSNLGVWALGRIGMSGWLAKIIMDTLLYFVSYRVQDRWVFGEDR